MTIDVQIPQPSLQVVPGSSGRLKFTVTNVTERAMSVVARAVPTDPAQTVLVEAGQLVVDRPSRHLPAGGMDEFVVDVALTPAAPAGTYGFVLRVASSDDDAVQVWGQSPAVSVTVPAVESPPARWPKWLLLAAALVVGIGIGVGVRALVADEAAWTSTVAIEEALLVLGGELPIGVTTSGPQTIAVSGVGATDLTVAEGPIVALPAGSGSDGERCTAALREARGAGTGSATAPIPVDGRALCAFVGLEEVGVIDVLRLTSGEVTISVVAWFVE